MSGRGRRILLREKHGVLKRTLTSGVARRYWFFGSMIVAHVIIDMIKIK